MDRKIRVGAVSYLNTKPLIYGFEKGMMKDSVELYIDYPAKVAEALVNDTIDIGLVPVAIIPFLKEYHIIGNYCIASDGEVASVCLFSDVPVNEISSVILDYQSRTSVMLAKMLLNEFWKINPQIVNSENDFIELVKGNTAGVVIGDRALELRSKYKYVYDLGLAWKSFTNLPFVYALWIANKALPDTFIEEFNRANSYGFQKLDEVIQANEYSFFDLKEYYVKNIKFVKNSTLR